MVQYYLESHNNVLIEEISIHNSYKEIVDHIMEKYGIKILPSEISNYMKNGYSTKDIFKRIRIREVLPINMEKKSKQNNKKKRMKCHCGYSNKYTKHKCNTNEN